MSDCWKDDLLIEVMECGYGDLSVLDDVEYDMSEILEMCHDWYGNYNLNNVMRVVFQKGIDDIADALHERLCELAGIAHEDLTEEEHEEYSDLLRLDPDEDIESFHNYLDTSVWFRTHGEIYEKYLAEAVHDFAMNTGYDISD